MPVVVSGQVPIAPGAGPAFTEAAVDLVRAARADPACSAYTMTIDPLEPTIVTIFEVWRDVESFAAYATSEDAATYARRTADLRTGPTLVTLIEGTVRHSGPAPAPHELAEILGGDRAEAAPPDER